MPEWAIHYNSDEIYEIPYFKSPEYSRLASKLEAEGLDMQDCVLIDIGHDGFQPFKRSDFRSTWGVWLRVKNVSPRIHYRYMNVKELSLLPRSTRSRSDKLYLQPSFDTVWEGLIKELADLCIPENPMTVYDGHTQTHREVYVVLAGLFADGPARKKTNCAGGATSHFPCQWCVMQSRPVARTLYAGGYLSPAIVDKFQPMRELLRSRGIQRPADVLKAKAGDTRLKLSDQE